MTYIKLVNISLQASSVRHPASSIQHPAASSQQSAASNQQSAASIQYQSVSKHYRVVHLLMHANSMMPCASFLPDLVQADKVGM